MLQKQILCVTSSICASLPKPFSDVFPISVLKWKNFHGKSGKKQPKKTKFLLFKAKYLAMSAFAVAVNMFT